MATINCGLLERYQGNAFLQEAARFSIFGDAKNQRNYSLGESGSNRFAPLSPSQFEE